VTSDSGEDVTDAGKNKESCRHKRPTSARPRAVRQPNGSYSCRPPRSPSSTSAAKYSPSSSSDYESVEKSETSSHYSLQTDPYKLMPFVYSPPPPASTSSTQPQDQAVYVVGDRSMLPAPVIIPNDNYSSYRSHMKLAVIVFFCCGFLFGLGAFLLAGEY
jgi:hypothetical protein